MGRGLGHMTYTVSRKKGHVIFDYKSRISWCFFIIFIPLETGTNIPRSYIIYLLDGLMMSQLCDIARHESYNVGYEKCSTLFSTITMVVFDRFYNFCTVGNRNEYSTKRVQTVSLQLNYVYTLPGKTKNNTKTAARSLQHSVESIVPKFYRKSFNVRFFPYLLDHPFSSLPTKDLLHSRWFYQKFIFKFIW